MVFFFKQGKGIFVWMELNVYKKPESIKNCVFVLHLIWKCQIKWQWRKLLPFPVRYEGVSDHIKYSVITQEKLDMGK